MPTIDNWRALREALDAGPTDKPWSLEPVEDRSIKHLCPVDADGLSILTVVTRDDTPFAAVYLDADAHYIAAAHPAAIRALLDERDRLASEVEALKDAARINLENYEFQRNKADAATATVYQFHYAMKDAGWHPGRTDDNLCDILRAKGQELAGAAAEVEALRASLALAANRMDVLALDHEYSTTRRNIADQWAEETRAAIDAAMKGKP